MRRGRIEILTVGFNPNLQLVGSDPTGSPNDLGLFIGPNGNIAIPSQRQLFVLCAKRFNVGQRGRLVGFREYLTIGSYLTTADGNAHYPLERPVETPTWKYVDGNVLWGIRQIPPETHLTPNALNANGVIFEYSQTPALLFETNNGAGVVTPPYGGMFPGNVLSPELGWMYDLRCRRWSKPVHVDVPFEGPCDIAFFASVQQTNPATRENPPAPTVPGNTFLTTQGTVPEDAFVQTYVNSTYFRIAGALIFEMEEQAPTGAPKTYRRPGDGDRLTRDTTEVGDNTMRRSAEDTSEYKACEGNQPPGQPGTQHPASPPHPNAHSTAGRTASSFAGLPLEELHARALRMTGLSGLPKESGNGGDGVVNRLIRTWRTGFGEREPKKLPVPPRQNTGLGKVPGSGSNDRNSEAIIQRLVQKWRIGKGNAP